MDLSDAKIIPDLRLYGLLGVSRECGRRALEKLEVNGAISPRRTPTGRTMLSFKEAEAVVQAFSRVAA